MNYDPNQLQQTFIFFVLEYGFLFFYFSALQKHTNTGSDAPFIHDIVVVIYNRLASQTYCRHVLDTFLHMKNWK